MKIAISEIEPQHISDRISDLDLTVGETIVGGDTQVEVFAGSYAAGDFAVTKSDANVYNLEF